MTIYLSLISYYLLLTAIPIKLALSLLSCSTFIANHRSSIPLEQFATSSYADLSSNQELYGIEQANYCYFEFGEKGLNYAKGFNGTIGKIPPEYDSVEFFGNNTDGNYLAEKIYSIYMWIHISTTNSLGKKPYHPERTEKECPFAELKIDKHGQVVQVKEQLRQLQGPYYKCAVQRETTHSNYVIYSFSGVNLDAFGNIGEWNNKSSTEYVLNDRPEALVAFYESLLTEKKSVPPVPKVPEEDGSQIGVAIILGLIFLKDLFKDIIRGVYWIYVKMYHPIRTEHKHERLIECLEGNRTPIQPKKRQSFERAEEVTYASSNSAHDSD